MTIWLETERRSALITGGSRGIGRGIATHLSQQGWTLTLVGRARVQLAQVHSELDIAAAAVHIVAADQTVDAAIELHRRTFGSMIALILAAGVARPDPSRTIPKPRLDKQIALNFRSPFLLAGQAMPLCGREPQRVGQGARASSP
jgi:3-oxoacyl-[acyl-carrier protein] reductase